MRPLRPAIFALLALASVTARGFAQTPPLTPDVPAHFDAVPATSDYVKRVAMIPMRDGVKLYTVIVIPRGAAHAPMILTRTPYNAAGRTERFRSTHMLATLPEGDEVFVADGYIRVFQDVRGKYGSEGEYLMTRPLRGPLNASEVDHSTDAYDTIDWLVKNVPESNGRVGMLGSSYEGFTVVMALVHPHPALKVAAPESPMVDGWMGDDWFHYGAFRQPNFDYFTQQTSARGAGAIIPREGYDDYENFRRAGSAGDFARAAGLDQLAWWRKVSEHPAYDSFWQEQALDRVMAAQPLTVPTMWVQGLWDQEDMWGAIHSFLAVEPKDTANDRNFLVMGPWRHSQTNYNGSIARAARVAGRHRARVPPRRAEAVLRPVPEGRRAESRDAAGVHLQHRREPLGPPDVLAARLRGGLRGRVTTDLPHAGVGPVVPGAGGDAKAPAPSTSTSRTRPSPCRTCRGPPGSPMATPGGDGWSRISGSSRTAPTCSATSRPCSPSRSGSAAHRS